MSGSPGDLRRLSPSGTRTRLISRAGRWRPRLDDVQRPRSPSGPAHSPTIARAADRRRRSAPSICCGSPLDHVDLAQMRGARRRSTSASPSWHGPSSERSGARPESTSSPAASPKALRRPSLRRARTRCTARRRRRAVEESTRSGQLDQLLRSSDRSLARVRSRPRACLAGLGEDVGEPWWSSSWSRGRWWSGPRSSAGPAWSSVRRLVVGASVVSVRRVVSGAAWSSRRPPSVSVERRSSRVGSGRRRSRCVGRRSAASSSLMSSSSPVRRSRSATTPSRRDEQRRRPATSTRIGPGLLVPRLGSGSSGSIGPPGPPGPPDRRAARVDHRRRRHDRRYRPECRPAA